MSTPKPKKADVEAVMVAMEKKRPAYGKDYRSVAHTAAFRLTEHDDGSHDDYELLAATQSLIDAALRLLLRRKDKVIRAFRAEERAFQENKPDEEQARLHVMAVATLEQYDDERRGRRKGK